MTAISWQWSMVSNACPNYGWYTPDLDRWPRWDIAFHSPARMRIARMRVWTEAVVSVRVAAKTLAAPFGLLKVASAAHLSPSFGAFLALSYLFRS